MKVLMIGPSVNKSKGGMATVLKDIIDDDNIFKNIVLEHYASYADGNKMYVALYSVISFLYFYFFCRGYDIYHIHMASKGSTYRKMLYIRTIKKWNKKVIVHMHSGRFIEFFNSLDAFRQSKIKTTLQNVDVVIALSPKWKNLYCKVLGVTNCIVIENGINVDFYKKASCNIVEYICSFLFLGRMTKNKGIYDLIQAVDRIKNYFPGINVYLAGDGEIEKISQIVHSLNLDKNLKVVGWVNNNEKLELLKKVGTLVLPSYHEALPMSILEGMASGKIIVATNVGAIPEVVNDENGFVLPPGDIDKLASVLGYIMSGAYDVNSISKNNMDKIENFYSIEAMHKKIMKCYYELYKK